MPLAYSNRQLFVIVFFWFLVLPSEKLEAQIFNQEYTSPIGAYASLSIEHLGGDTVMILPLHYDLQLNRIGFESMIIGPSGALISSRIYLDSSSNLWIGWANSLNKISSGNFIFAGYKLNNHAELGMVSVLDRNGDTLWTKLYGDTSTSVHRLQQARETANGDLIIVGSHAYFGQRGDGWLLRLDSNGNKLWDKIYSTSLGTRELLLSVQETYDGGFILGGQEQEFPNNQNTRNYDPILIKTDSAGNQQWRYRYDTPYDDPTNYCIQTFDSNYVCAGSYTYKINGLYRSRSMLFKMSKNGQFIWKKEYGPLKSRSSFYMVKQLADSTLIAVGKRYKNSNVMVGTMMRAKPNGDSIFVRSYEYNPNQTLKENRLHDVVQMSDGGFMACGEVIHDQTVSNRQNPWLIRTDSNGCILSSCLVGVEEQEFEGESKRISVYPNPTKGKFQLSGLDERPLQMMLFDLQGREIKSFDPKQANWQLPEAKGMYLLRIETREGEWLNRKILKN